MRTSDPQWCPENTFSPKFARYNPLQAQHRREEVGLPSSRGWLFPLRPSWKAGLWPFPTHFQAKG